MLHHPSTCFTDSVTAYSQAVFNLKTWLVLSKSEQGLGMVYACNLSYM
jgi:hypothetical protein